MTCARFGTTIKVNAVLEVARRDPNWAAELYADPAQAIRDAGLDLTAEEIAAVIEIVNGSRSSLFANPLARRIIVPN